MPTEQQGKSLSFVRRHHMALSGWFGRILKERRLFMRCATALFTAVFIGVFTFLLEARGGVLVWVVLVSLGGGWLMAYYMWHVNYAAANAWGPLTPSKSDGDRNGDV